MPIGFDRVQPGTISALAVAWYTSAHFKHLAPSTQRTYRGILERFRAKHGDKRVGSLEAAHLRGILDARSDTPQAANNLLRVVRMLMSFGVERGWRKDNPALTVRRIRARVAGFHSWTEDEIATYEARWPEGSRERLALALLIFTGQRRGDVVRMGRQHVQGGALHVVQGKTKARLALPLHPVLKAILDVLPADNLTFLVTHIGQPFSPEGFSNWFTKSARAAGLPIGCSPHGLRKAAARRLAEAGCSANEIGAITGHRTLSEITRYTAAADQARLAERAMDRMRQTG